MATSSEFVASFEADKDLLLSRVNQLVFEEGEAGFECRRCDRVLIRHYIANNCGHRFCANCKRVLIVSKSNCPLPDCRKSIENIDRQDIEFERKLFDLRASCPNKNYGCPFVSQLKNLGAHLRVCRDTRDNALPVLIGESSSVEMILRELSNKFNRLSADVIQMKEKTKTIDKRVQRITTEVENQMKNIETKLDSSLREIEKKTEVMSAAIEENKRYADEKMSELNTKKNEIKEEKKLLINSEKSNEINNLEQKLFNLERLILIRNPQMNGFTLAENNGNYPPDFTWKIRLIKDVVNKGNYNDKSQVFPWNGYPVQSLAKMNVLYGAVYMSLRILSYNELNLKVIPHVYFALRNQTNASNLKLIRSSIKRYAFGSKFNYSLDFDSLISRNSLLTDPPYNVDDSIVVDVYVELPAMAQLVHSYNGTLNWKIDNYRKRKQLEKDDLVLYQESPYFYTGPRGYRVQLRIFLNGFGEYNGKGLSVEIDFISGEFDADLPATFLHRTTITIFHQDKWQRNITVAMEKDIQKNKYYVIDIICKDNEINNFLINDTLIYEVTIQPSN